MTEVKMNNGRPAIFIDGKVYPPMLMTVRTRENGKAQSHFDKEYFRNLGNAGIKLFLLHCNTLWLQPEALEMFDYEARQLLEVVPDAQIIPRIGLHPTNEWILQNPDECLLYSNGLCPPVHLFSESYETDIPRAYSLLSSKWREDAGNALAETWKKLMELPYADHIFGCMPAAGSTSEWGQFYSVIDFRKPNTALDSSECFRREFSAYLRETYGTDENLQKHWKNPNATIDNPPVPTYEEFYFAVNLDEDVAHPKVRVYANTGILESPRNGTNKGAFIDFDKCLHVYDFFRAWHLGTAKSQIHFAKVIKSITPDKLVGMAYGAQGAADYLFGGRTAGANLILNSGVVDFSANPSVYNNRGQGGYAGQRVPEDSYPLHNMLYIAQEDNRTCAEHRVNRRKYEVYDMTDSLNQMKREFGRDICNDMYGWWFDQLLGGKRYKFPEMYDLFRQQTKIAHEAYSLNRVKESEVAFIFDEKTFHSISFESSADLVVSLRNYEIGRLGTTCAQYFYNDMSNPKMPSYKMYVFVNTFILTKEEREMIKAKLKREHAVAVWLYAPGYVDPTAMDNRMSVENIRDLTGFEMETIDELYEATFRWNGEEHPISAPMDKRKYYGIFGELRKANLHAGSATERDTCLYPFFYPVDKDAKNLAYFLTSDKPAVSIKEYDGFTSIYYGSKTIKYDVLREMARFAGAHVWYETDDVAFIGKNYLTFHASSTGKKKISFPKPTSVYEVYEEKWYAKDALEVEFDAYLGETKMFRMV